MDKNNETNRIKNNKENKISKKLMLCWPSTTLSTSVAAALFGYATFYATDIMGLSAITVGFIFMLSKIFDGVTDVIVGFIIDKTNSKLGKGRPYELALIGYWISIVAFFAAPSMGVNASCIYLFVTYTLVNSVFLTFLNCNNPVYMANALENQEHSITLSAVTGFISLIATMIASMILPSFIDAAGKDRTQWMIISAVLAVPMTLIGLIRFFTIKERQNIKQQAEALNLKEMLSMIFHNKYIILFSVIIFMSNIGTNLVNNVQTYYFQYIVGDLSQAGIMSLSMLTVIIIMLITPMLSRKFGFVNVMRATSLIGAAGYLVRLLFPTNVLLLFVSNIFAMVGFYTTFGFAATFIIDCIDYGEWKNGVRSEGSIACAQSVTAKIGTAIGVALVGVLMGWSGYDGTAAVQVQSANNMLIALFSVIPAAFCVIQFIFLKFYDLDKILPQIREDLKARRG